jgi:hypothetical protein
MRRTTVAIFATAILLSLAGRSNASILAGATVGYEYHFPGVGSVIYTAPTFVVGPGVETGLFQPSPDYAAVDVSDTNIFVDFIQPASFAPGAFNGIRLFDVNNAITSFTSVTVNAATNMFGFTSANVSFDADNIYINWQGLPFDENTIVSLDINGAPGTVPEPASVAVWAAIACISGVVGYRRLA